MVRLPLASANYYLIFNCLDYGFLDCTTFCTKIQLSRGCVEDALEALDEGRVVLFGGLSAGSKS